MSKVTYTGSIAQKLKKPKFIVGTLFTGKETDDAEPLGDSYIFEEIERDTTSISQDDNDSNDIECETSDNPIDSTVSLGKWQVSAELDSVSDQLLIDIMDFYEDVNGNICAPPNYQDKFIRFEVVYKIGVDESGKDQLIAMRVPKMKLNSRLVLESLNSNLGKITIAGTAQNIRVNKGTESAPVYENTPFMKVPNYALPTGD